MMSSKQTILDRELFTQALRHMGEEDLLYLNRMVVERLNLLAQAKSTVELAQFAEGDRVPPRQNSCRLDRTKNPGAAMKDDSGSIRTSIQRQSGGQVAAAGERLAGGGLA